MPKLELELRRFRNLHARATSTGNPTAAIVNHHCGLEEKLNLTMTALDWFNLRSILISHGRRFGFPKNRTNSEVNLPVRNDELP